MGNTTYTFGPNLGDLLRTEPITPKPATLLGFHVRVIPGLPDDRIFIVGKDEKGAPVVHVFKL